MDCPALIEFVLAGDVIDVFFFFGIEKDWTTRLFVCFVWYFITERYLTHPSTHHKKKKNKTNPNDNTNKETQAIAIVVYTKAKGRKKASCK